MLNKLWRLPFALKLAVCQKTKHCSNYVNSFRSLYNAYYLGLEGFAIQNSKIRAGLGNEDVNFIQRMDKILESSDKKDIVYADDLKNIIALCHDKQEYLDLVIKLNNLYYKNIEKLDLRPFRFGPQIMRLLHHHQFPDKAFQLLMDERVRSIYSQAISFQLAMDLLYENGRYNDVVSLMDVIISANPFPLPTSCLTLALGANYKLGTEKDLESSMKLFHFAVDEQKKLTFKIIGFVAGLAVKRGKYDVATQVLAHSSSINHFIIENLRILSMAYTENLEEIIETLRVKSLIDIPKTSAFTTKYVYCYDVLDRIEKIIRDTLDEGIINSFKHLKAIFHNSKLISPMSLDESICSPIENVYRENRIER